MFHSGTRRLDVGGGIHHVTASFSFQQQSRGTFQSRDVTLVSLGQLFATFRRILLSSISRSSGLATRLKTADSLAKPLWELQMQHFQTHWSSSISIQMHFRTFDLGISVQMPYFLTLELCISIQMQHFQTLELDTSIKMQYFLTVELSISIQMHFRTFDLGISIQM